MIPPMRAIAAVLILLSPRAATPPVSNSTVNVNGAGEQELRTLPGIGREEAKRIIARRPYSTPADFFERAGIAPAERATLADRIRFDDARPPDRAAGRPIALEPGRSVPAQAPPPSRRLDVNRATIRELSAIHGLVPFAPRIVLFRPYKNLGELSKAGVPREVILDCSKYLRVGAAPEGK